MNYIPAKKSLGQNFLNSPGALQAIIDAGNVQKGDVVLEIGPGKGALTKRLLEKNARVYVVEKDDRLIPYLSELFSDYIRKGTLTILHKDVLELIPEEIEKFGTYKLIANIPYYITGEIMRMFLSRVSQPQSMTLLVQKEVAERIVAQDKKESILSLSVKLFGTPHYIKTVKAGSFSPAPKVDSAILHIANISRPHISEEKFFTLIKKAFAHKRKTLGSNLKGLVEKDVLASCGIHEKARAEDLSLSDWIHIVKKIN